MSIVSCLNPKKVVNRYTHEEVTVPCGHCSSCLNQRGLRMTQRLDQERMCWKYCIFFTLTYDNDNLPLLIPADSYLVDKTPKRIHPITGIKLLNRQQVYHKLGIVHDDEVKSNQFIQLCINHFGGLPYLSTLDIQRFVKRLRINFERSSKKIEDYERIYNEKVPSFRYCICGEYGSTCLRPHYHGLLFTSSEYIAQVFGEMCRKCWKYGHIDFSFVSSSNSGYVAKYVNSFAHLPAIYKANEIRPFLLFSKHPALGTLIYNTEVYKSLFDSCSTSQIIYQAKKAGAVSDVPLWRTIQDRLYPKLTGFDVLTHFDRVRLYSASNKSFDPESYACFRGFIETTKDSFIGDYVALLKKYDGNINNKLIAWFNTSRRVITQAQVFGISVREYVKKIEKYYSDKNYKILVEYYKSIEEYTEKQKSAISLIGIDREFIESVRDLDWYDLDAHEQLYFKSFKDLDIEKFFSSDFSVRLEYQAHLDFDESLAYKSCEIINDSILRNSCKVKKKNDYLNLLVGLHADEDNFYHNVSQINF